MPLSEKGRGEPDRLQGRFSLEKGKEGGIVGDDRQIRLVLPDPDHVGEFEILVVIGRNGGSLGKLLHQGGILQQVGKHIAELVQLDRFFDVPNHPCKAIVLVVNGHVVVGQVVSGHVALLVLVLTVGRFGGNFTIRMDQVEGEVQVFADVLEKIVEV